MDQSPNLRLPYLIPAQAQKHVTHNEALRALDAVVQVGVLDRDLTNPPASPTDGDRYIVATGATGAWAGAAGKIAAWQDGVWEIYQPKAGWLAWVADEGKLLAWNGAAWVVAGGSASVNPAPLVGVNTTADTTNRLAVKSDAALFSHDDVTPGSGDHRTILNKAAANKTAAFVFQDNFSGRAELGLTGDDDLHFKVSADGATWKDALLVDRTSGAVSMPFTPRREVLSANRTYYVRPDGNNANSGLSNTAGGAFLTIQKAINVVAALDLSIYSVTIQCAAGTYAGANVPGPWIGTGSVTLLGDATTPANCIINAAGSFGIAVSNYGRLNVSGFKFQGAGGACAIAQDYSLLNFTGPVEFGAAAVHVYVVRNSTVNLIQNYTISGGANQHVSLDVYCVFNSFTKTITLTGTPAFSHFIVVGTQSFAYVHANIYSGAATGQRYVASTGSFVYAGGAGATYLPGNTAGSLDASSYYI